MVTIFTLDLQDEEAEKIKQERLKMYEEKKAKSELSILYLSYDLRTGILI